MSTIVDDCGSYKLHYRPTLIIRTRTHRIVCVTFVVVEDCVEFTLHTARILRLPLRRTRSASRKHLRQLFVVVVQGDVDAIVQEEACDGADVLKHVSNVCLALGMLQNHLFEVFRQTRLTLLMLFHGNVLWFVLCTMRRTLPRLLVTAIAVTTTCRSAHLCRNALFWCKMRLFHRIRMLRVLAVEETVVTHNARRIRRALTEVIALVLILNNPLTCTNTSARHF